MLESEASRIAQQYEQEIGLSITRNPQKLPWEAVYDFTMATVAGPLLMSTSCEHGVWAEYSRNEQEILLKYAQVAATKLMELIEDRYGSNPLFALDLTGQTCEQGLLQDDLQDRSLTQLRNLRQSLRETQKAIKSDLRAVINDPGEEDTSLEESVDQILRGQKSMKGRSGYYYLDLGSNRWSSINTLMTALGIQPDLYGIRDQSPGWRRTGVEAWNLPTLALGALGHLTILKHDLVGEGWAKLGLSFERDAVIKIVTDPDLPPIL